jgi:hypothetical protein
VPNSRQFRLNAVTLRLHRTKFDPFRRGSVVCIAALAASAVAVAAEEQVWGQLVFPLEEGWTEMAMPNPESHCVAAPGDTHRVVVTVVELPDTPRSFGSLAVRGFFFGLRRTVVDLGPTSDTTVAGCPARRFDMTVSTDSGPVTMPTWVVLLDPGIYSISIFNLDDEAARLALIESFRLAPGAAPPPPVGPRESFAFKLGIAVGALVALFVLVGVVIVIVVVTRRGKRRGPPAPPPRVPSPPPPPPSAPSPPAPPGAPPSLPE